MLYMIYMVKDDQEMKGKPKMAKKKPEKKSKKNELARVSNDSQVAHELSSQYGIVAAKANETLREAVKFGAMLIEWGSFLGESRGGDGGTDGGEGLKGWLAKHCPEINYQTAMGYKHLAEKQAKMIGGGKMAIAALLGRDEIVTPAGEVVDVEAKIIEKRDKIFSKADSRRKLEQMFLDFGKGRAGRPKGSKAVESAPLTKVESARRLWANIIYQVVKGRAGLYSAAKLLPREDADKSYGELKALCDALKARLDEKD